MTDYFANRNTPDTRNMAKSRAAIQAAYRARKKQEMGEAAYLEAERLRIKKRYVPVHKLSKQKQKQRRADVLLRVQRHRANKKKVMQDIEANKRGDHGAVEMQDMGNGQNIGAESDDSAISEGESEVSDNSKMIIKMPFMIHQTRKIQTRKRTSRALSRAHRRITELEKKLKRNKKISKRCERAVNKMKKLPTDPRDPSLPGTSKVGLTSTPSRETPRSKVAAQLRGAGFSPRSVSQKFKRQLQFSQAIFDEVRNASEQSKKQHERKMLNRIISGKVIKKYRFISQTKRNLGMDRRALTRVNNKDIGHCIGLKQQRRLWVNLQNEVLAFLQREDNSRVMPGKKDACKSGDLDQKSQIRVLNDYINNLYQKYTTENADKRHISLSAFKRVRQRNPHIKLVNYTARNTSLCQKHQNMSLMLKALATKVNGLSSKSPDDFVAKYDDAAIGSLLNKLKENEAIQNIDFDVWKRTPAENGQKKTKLVHSVLGKEEFINNFIQSVQEFRNHVVRVKTQYNAIHKCKETLPNTECVVQMDFAENYTCVPLEEVQSGYWNQESVTLHPTVIYYRDPENNTLKHQSYVAVSDDRGHNTSTIKAILDSLVPRVTKLVPGVKQIHYWTDSPTAQYRNKTIFSLVSDHHVMFDGIYARWNYFECGHGKGPCDGVGGTVKRLADDAVKRGAVIQDAHDFYTWAIQERENTGIEYYFVSKDDCTSSGEMINKKWSGVKSIPGTLRIHAVIGMGDQRIMCRDLSCYCQFCVCPNPSEHDIGGMCSGWVIHSLSGSNPSIQMPPDETPAQATASPDEVPTNETLVPTNEVSLEESREDELPVYQSDDWVAGLYDDNWYIGQVIDADDEDVHITFMKAACKGSNYWEHTYTWPTVQDKIWVPKANVLCRIEAPTRMSRRVYKLSSDQAANISNVYRLRQMRV